MFLFRLSFLPPRNSRSDPEVQQFSQGVHVLLAKPGAPHEAGKNAFADADVATNLCPHPTRGINRLANLVTERESLLHESILTLLVQRTRGLSSKKRQFLKKNTPERNRTFCNFLGKQATALTTAQNPAHARIVPV
jgi:hypothetical protein